MRNEYSKTPKDQTWWCNTHERQATHRYFDPWQGKTIRCCDPSLDTFCSAVNLTGIAELAHAV